MTWKGVCQHENSNQHDEDTPVTQPALRMGVFVSAWQGIDEACYYFE